MTDLPLREKSPAWRPYSQDIAIFFLALRLELKHWCFLDIKTANLLVSSFLTQHANFGTCQDMRACAHTHTLSHTHTHTYTYILSILFIWRNLTKYSSQKSFHKIEKLEDVLQS